MWLIRRGTNPTMIAELDLQITSRPCISQGNEVNSGVPQAANRSQFACFKLNSSGRRPNSDEFAVNNAARIARIRRPLMQAKGRIYCRV
jgi:hypothetical protein